MARHARANVLSHLQLFPAYITEQQPVNMVGEALDMLLPVAHHQGAVHGQQHFCPVAHVLWECWEGEVNEEGVATPPACLHAPPCSPHTNAILCLLSLGLLCISKLCKLALALLG